VNGGKNRTSTVLVALLCVAAGALIVKIGGHSGFSDGRAQAIGMAFAAVFFLLTAMAGANLARNRPELSWLGYLTATASAFAVAGIALSIWGHPGEGTGKVVAVMALLAFAGAHASLLLGLRHKGDSGNVLLLRNATLALLALLAILLAYAIFSRGGGLNGREVAVVAILYVLGGALLTVFRSMVATSPPPPPVSGTALIEQLRQSGFEPVDVPAEKLTAPGHSVYFRSSDGSLIALTHYG
jgi:hypothetical protein